jgi:GntR family transcriptional regulator
MLSDVSSLFPKNPVSEKCPAYRELAGILKDKIAAGEYALGSKIPSEIKISQQYGLSTMTVRQAVGLLVQAGLVARIQGSGTYVTSPVWTSADLSWTCLSTLLEDRSNISLSIYKAGLVNVGPKTAEHLKLQPHDQVVFMDRLICHKSQPLLLNHSVLKYDPRAPLVEAELELVTFSYITTGLAQKYIKKSQLWVVPTNLSAEECAKLALPPSDIGLKINYTLYDFEDEPLGSGWFLAPKKMAKLAARTGMWNN